MSATSCNAPRPQWGICRRHTSVLEARADNISAPGVGKVLEIDIRLARQGSLILGSEGLAVSRAAPSRLTTAWPGKRLSSADMTPVAAAIMNRTVLECIVSSIVCWSSDAIVRFFFPGK